ncbi:MAG: gluconate 2-dehydrogenase subunit 3 family protein [Balneola sp.]|nr:MAG: gluconate 2-dehydrogenase subunit 3 family protein [Balneola sp.]
MKRRDALKTLMLATSGALVMPSWAIGWTRDSLPNISAVFTETELALLSSIVDTILPSNGTLGGLSLGVDTFLAGLISECYETEVHEIVKARLRALDEEAVKDFDINFKDCSAPNREKLLLSFSESSDEMDQTFFNFIKEETIRGFETSEVVMVEYHEYEIMPGHFFGCIDVEEK